MNSLRIFTTAVLLAVLQAGAQADTSKILADISNRADGAMAMMEYKIEDESGSRKLLSEAVCIDSSGIFMTLSLNVQMKADTLKDFRLILPGPEGRSIKAKLMGIDPETRIGFVKATEPHSWKAVVFAPQSNLTVGQQVVSVGLMPASLGRVPYLGTGFVSAVVRTPGRLVLVTGGRLTRGGSPVFATDGRAIGIVSKQIPMSYSMLTRSGRANISLQGQQQTIFFTPVEEFVHILERIPSSPDQVRRLPWLGTFRMEGIGKVSAEAIGLDRPGVRIEEIVPDHAAAKAGLQDRDVIVGLNGKDLEKLAMPELTAQNFARQIGRMAVGDRIILTVFRDRKTFTATLALEAMPTQPHEVSRYINAELGFGVREKVLADRHLDKSPTGKLDGLIVLYTAPLRPAVAAGLRQGDVVTAVNDEKTATVAEFKRIVDNSLKRDPKKAIILSIGRGNQTDRIRIQP
ncbi:MAG: PDZ domain-containing protein [Phycisphaerae bacterium]|nr:PDZ domain-containing protein [Phycisphaerae bacterium]